MKAGRQVRERRRPPQGAVPGALAVSLPGHVRQRCATSVAPYLAPVQGG
jgi:hypothetical protein